MLPLFIFKSGNFNHLSPSKRLEIKGLHCYFCSCDPRLITLPLLVGEGNINIKKGSQSLLSLV